MKIKILGWGYENIRRFDTLNFDLRQDDDLTPHIALVMMRNGTGKTTTTTLMRAVLSGSAVYWTSEQIRDFMPQHGQPEYGKFFLKVRFDEDEYHFILTLDYMRGTVSYQTTRIGLSGGQNDGLNLPMQIRGAFDKVEFVNRFIFDGEQAHKTLSTGNKEAEMAIVNLYQISDLDSLIKKIEELVKKKQDSSFGAATSRSVTVNRTKVANRKATLDHLEQRYESLKRRKAFLADKVDSLTSRKIELIASDEQLRKKQEDLLTDQELTSVELKRAFAVIEYKIKEPFQIHGIFHNRLQEFTQNLKTLKLPKTIAREFFKELAENDDCVCGRSIGQEEKQIILSRAENYLGEEDLSAINAIKDRLNNYILDNDLKDAYQQMLMLKEHLRKVRNALDRLALSLDDQANKEIQSIDKELISLQEDASIVEKDLRVLSAPSSAVGATDQNNLYLARAAWEEANRNFLEATGTYEFTIKSEKLITYIKRIRQAAISRLKKTIIEKTNEKISRILTDEKLMIERIDGNLVLQGKASVSEGQTLAVAYAYIGSLFEHSSFEFPFVVDSPAASMDLEVRREVAMIIPQLFEQLVIFVTSGEVAGFAEKFYDRDDVLYATILGQSEHGGAICEFGKDFFSTYQSEEE